MKRIIIIDGCSANIIFPAGNRSLPIETLAVTGGRLAKAAMILGKTGHDVTMMGEAARDRLGDLIVEHLKASGVDTSCIDRYSDGAPTPAIMTFSKDDDGSQPASIVYHTDIAEHWDSKWPLVDSADIVVFGGYFSLQPRVRPRLVDFLTYVRDRGAFTIYVPGFNQALVPAVTRIMPALLENFEMADAVVTATSDLCHLFPGLSPEDCFSRKISFYTGLMVNIDEKAQSIEVMHRNLRAVRHLPETHASPERSVVPMPIAMFADVILRNSITPGATKSLAQPLLETIADMISTSDSIMCQ